MDRTDTTVAGLRAAAQACDGTGPATRLVDALFALLGISGPERLAPAVGAMSRERLAALAPAVIAAAEAGDAVAEAILDAAVAALARQVQAVAAGLGSATDRWPLALAGGVLVHSSSFRQRLIASVQQCGVGVAATNVVAEPVAGAVRLAAALRTRGGGC